MHLPFFLSLGWTCPYKQMLVTSYTSYKLEYNIVYYILFILFHYNSFDYNSFILKLQTTAFIKSFKSCHRL